MAALPLVFATVWVIGAGVLVKQADADSFNRTVTAYLPNFILAGTQKGGTSDLAGILRGHPEILMPKRELHFYDRCDDASDGNCPRGDFWADVESLDFRDTKSLRHTYCCTANGYAAKMHDHLSPRIVDEAHPLKVIAEKTPCYMAEKAVFDLIKKITPNAKLLVALRDPVDRAWSEYEMEVAQKRIPKDSFDTTIEAQLKHYDETRTLVNLTRLDSKHYDRAYISRGIYVDQLQWLYSLFPKEQILVLIAEQLWVANDYSNITKFLNLSTPLVRPPGAQIRNKRAKGKTMAAKTRTALRKFFSGPNMELCHLLRKTGMSCPPWTSYDDQD